MKKCSKPRTYADGVEHHSAAGSGVRAAGHFHHHHHPAGEGRGFETAHGREARERPAAQGQLHHRARPTATCGSTRTPIAPGGLAGDAGGLAHGRSGLERASCAATPRRNTNRSAPCWMSASRPTCRRWTWRPNRLAKRIKTADAPAIPAAQKAQLVEGQPDDFVRRFMRCSWWWCSISPRAGLARQAVEENHRDHGEKGKAAGETEGTAQGRAAESRGTAQSCGSAQEWPQAPPPSSRRRWWRRPRPSCRPLISTAARPVISSSDPVQLYKGCSNTPCAPNGTGPEDMADDNFVAEVEVAVDRDRAASAIRSGRKVPATPSGTIPCAQAIAATTSMTAPPPTNFPPRVIVRFDVQRKRPNPSCNETEKNHQTRARHDERAEHHAAAGPGVRAAGHFHHHHAADDEQPGDDAALAANRRRRPRRNPRSTRSTWPPTARSPSTTRP